MSGGKELGVAFARHVKRATDVASLTFVHLAQTDQFDVVTISEHADLFPVWDEHWTGKQGTIVRDAGNLYKAIHDVGVGQNTKPSDTPSMWTRIGDPREAWPEWVAPIGAHDAYAAGAQVTHDGKHWVSDEDSNIWEPGVHGWTES